MLTKEKALMRLQLTPRSRFVTFEISDRLEDSYLDDELLITSLSRSRLLSDSSGIYPSIISLVYLHKREASFQLDRWWEQCEMISSLLYGSLSRLERKENDQLEEDCLKIIINSMHVARKHDGDFN